MRSILVILFASLCSGCMEPDCSNDIIQDLPSPNGKTRIVLFSRNCGATTGFNTQAMILNAGEPMPDEEGNVFIVDKGKATASWTNVGGILVTLDHEALVFKQEALVRGIPIEYRRRNDLQNGSGNPPVLNASP